MKELICLRSASWEDTISGPLQAEAALALESGQVLAFPNLPFHLRDHETPLLSPRLVKKAKNISRDPNSGRLEGTAAGGEHLRDLDGLLDRFARLSRRLLDLLVPAYRVGIQVGRTSLRPVEIAGRQLPWKQDDTRLHVDSFFSVPMMGRRILRVFTNVNPEGRPRVWRIGGPFEPVAHRFWPSLRRPRWGEARLLRALRLTRTVRSPYDHYMLQLHDSMKRDRDYQDQGSRGEWAFPAGSTWMAFTDQVPHAAVSGSHVLEQTFYVPLNCLRQEKTSPLGVLEGLAGRALVERPLPA